MATVTYGPAERALIFVHRWVGIILALLMTLWAVSGIVMLYVAFPDLADDELYSGLEPLNLADCCAPTVAASLEGSGQISVSMMADRPVARVSGYGSISTLDLLSGEWLEEVSPGLALTIATLHLESRGLEAPAASATQIHSDQWTVYSRFEQHRPLHKVTFDSNRGDVIYVSGTTGEVVQDTHSRERFWNWLGAVPHWLYFRAFRERQTLWYESVVYASVFGVLLVLSGLYLGIKRTLNAGGRWTQYLGPMRLHHLTGLIFGVLTFTWMLSGLLSMNPWGWLLSEGAASERARVSVDSLTATHIDSVLRAARDQRLNNVVTLVIAPTSSSPSLVAVDSESRRVRYMSSPFRLDPVSESEIFELFATMRPDAEVASMELLQTEDAYYFGHKSTVRLPVYRAVLSDAEATRYYVDANSGEIVLRVDAAGRWYRWLHHGLHRLDFGVLLRSRPLWDLVILPLLIGVTVLCCIGCWIGYRHLRYR